jgi:hypothetical protein
VAGVIQTERTKLYSHDRLIASSSPSVGESFTVGGLKHSKIVGNLIATVIQAGCPMCGRGLLGAIDHVSLHRAMHAWLDRVIWYNAEFLRAEGSISINYAWLAAQQDRSERYPVCKESKACR